jgi:hypothetical protein
MPTPARMTDGTMNCPSGQTGLKGGAQCSNDLTRNGPVALYNNPYVKLWDQATENDGISHVTDRGNGNDLSLT